MLVWSFGDAASAQETFSPPAVSKVFVSQKTENPIRIDGYLSEVDWENARISWEFLPLSYVYLVLNSSLIDHSDPLQRLNQQQYIAKVSYVHQF